MKQPDAITERDNLRRENAELKRIIAEAQDLAADRLSRISALEESLSQALGEVDKWRNGADNMARMAEEEKRQSAAAVRVADAIVGLSVASRALGRIGELNLRGDLLPSDIHAGAMLHKAEKSASDEVFKAVREYRALTEASVEKRVESATHNLDARAAACVGVWLEQGGDGEC